MPISCHFYDQLEVAAMKGQAVRLTFQPTQSKCVFEGIISDIFSQKGKEFFKTKSGEVWPLEGLVSIEVLHETQ
ncbi:MAG: hypothetical protein HUJ13_05180 [Hydrogenovibrio crunogenus]|nr:hypothetical protein [Hydrogenovibrio crunogenus]